MKLAEDAVRIWPRPSDVPTPLANRPIEDPNE